MYILVIIIPIAIVCGVAYISYKIGKLFEDEDENVDEMDYNRYLNSKEGK